MNKYIKYFSLILAFVLFSMIFIDKGVSASKYCTTSIKQYILNSGSASYYSCSGTVKIFLMEDDEANYSYFNTRYDYPYINKVNTNGTNVYYLKSLYVVAKGTDGKKLFAAGNNKWIKIYKDDAIVYDGSFRDTFEDQSYTERIPVYTEIGVYRIEQFANDGEFQHSIIVNVVGEQLNNFEISETTMLNSTLRRDTVNRVVKDGDNYSLRFVLNKEIFGIANNARIVINNDVNKTVYSSNLSTDEFSYFINFRGEDITPFLNINTFYNNTNTITLYVNDFLSNEQSFSYSVIVQLKNLSINLNTTKDEGIVASKKIEIKSVAGVGYDLKNESNLYFWSRNPSIALNKESFMENYDISLDKGRYVNEEGVIIRGKNGNYYLYVLAEDTFSSTVVRSEVVRLQSDQNPDSFLDSKDMIFTIFVIVISSMPIFIYVFIKGGKQTV